MSKVRYLILFAIFVASTVNYADRVALGVVGALVSVSLGLDSVAMGYILSASAIAYLLAQVPGGLLLDRFGSRWIYTAAIGFSAVLTLAQGWAGSLRGGVAVFALLLIRFMFGLASAPCVPANARITASWFPAAERGLATVIFNSSQYFALVAFAPLIGWIAHTWSWPWVFYAMGLFGLVIAAVFPLLVRSPLRHPLLQRQELEFIESHGGLVHIETPQTARITRESLKQVASHRLLLGLYLFQYCLGVISAFFLTWFPIYLVQQEGLSMVRAGVVTAVPALFGLLGNLTGGILSDALLRRSGSLTFARKLPVFVGLVLAATILACNFVQSQAVIVAIMSLAFFGKGLAALGWTMVSDTSPRNMIGATGGVFNMFGNMAAVTTPIAVGYIVAMFGSFDWAIVFISAHCLAGLVALLFVMGPIARIELQAKA